GSASARARYAPEKLTPASRAFHGSASARARSHALHGGASARARSHALHGSASARARRSALTCLAELVVADVEHAGAELSHRCSSGAAGIGTDLRVVVGDEAGVLGLPQQLATFRLHVLDGDAREQLLVLLAVAPAQRLGKLVDRLDDAALFVDLEAVH